MSRRSKTIRIALLPVWLIVWLVGGVAMVLAYVFNGVWETMDKLRDKFESWVNNVAPLD
ncbi:hypothetical protein HPM00_004175 [Salmonella enterica]|nr:hypothetical protein [Salmonella enterica]